MKTYTATQRALNIITNAVNEGFTFDQQDSFEDVRIAAEEYLIANTEHTEDECEINNVGRGQRLDWSDRMGFDYWEQGEIVDFSANWHKPADTKVTVATVLNSEGVVVDLYYLVGETDYNKEY